MSKLREQIDKGAAAQNLLDNPVLEGALSAIEDEIYTGWRDSTGDEKEQRETAYHMHRAVQALRVKLKGFVTMGDYAQKQLKEQNENART